jgi:DNA-binding NarL/FixJ family response regulator
VIRVTIYDSSPIFALGLADLVSRCPEFRVVQSFISVGDEPSWLTDLFVLDAEIETGHAAVELVSRLSSLAPVLLLVQPRTSRSSLEVLMDAGAGGFVETRATPTEVVKAMRHVAFRTTFECDGTTASQPLSPGQQQLGLSAREQQVLDLIARGLTHHQIASVINISRHTVDTYVKRIRSKLNVGNKAELTRVAVLRSRLA